MDRRTWSWQRLKCRSGLGLSQVQLIGLLKVQPELRAGGRSTDPLRLTPDFPDAYGKCREFRGKSPSLRVTQCGLEPGPMPFDAVFPWAIEQGT